MKLESWSQTLREDFRVDWNVAELKKKWLHDDKIANIDNQFLLEKNNKYYINAMILQFVDPLKKV